MIAPTVDIVITRVDAVITPVDGGFVQEGASLSRKASYYNVIPVSIWQLPDEYRISVTSLSCINTTSCSQAPDCCIRRSDMRKRHHFWSL